MVRSGFRRFEAIRRLAWRKAALSDWYREISLTDFMICVILGMARTKCSSSELPNGGVRRRTVRKSFLITSVILLIASLSSATPSSPDPRSRATTGPGIRYQLAEVLGADSKIHTIMFVLYDSAGKTVVSEKFTGRLPKGLTNPIFALFRDGDAFAEATGRAKSLTVTLDGRFVENIPFRELQSRASDLTAIDSSRSPFLNRRPKGIAISATEAPAAIKTAGPKPHPHQEDVWPGCNQDDYCLAQWNYCNDNCSPWDPYNPCQACDSNWTECTGGVELSAWSEDTLVSYSFVLFACNVQRTQTWTYDNLYIHHQEFQSWLCQEEDGNHYNTVTTADYYYTTHCYAAYSMSSCLSSDFPDAYIDCTF
jgi:hypothetical protein